MALVTLARARQNAALASVSDADLTVMINAASTYIEQYCDRKFESSTATSEKHDGNDLDCIFLDNSQVTSINSLTITEGDGTETSIGTGNVSFDNQTDNCRLFFDENNSSSFAYFPWGLQNITVTYQYGYSVIPADIQEACVQMVKNMYSQNSNANDPAFKSERLGDYQYTLNDGLSTGGSAGEITNGGGGLLTAQVEQLLSSYVRTVI